MLSMPAREQSAAYGIFIDLILKLVQQVGQHSGMPLRLGRLET
jgi:hypothetical protein